MPKGKDTSKHPNRQVGMSQELMNRLYGDIKPNFPLRAQKDTSAQDWMDDPSKAPYIHHTPATFSPETLKEFGLDEKDED